MPSFALFEIDGEFEIEVLDGLSLYDSIFDEFNPAIEASGTVVMDFREVPYVNAVFVCALSKLKKALDRQNRELVLKNLSDEMQEILDCVRFPKLRII